MRACCRNSRFFAATIDELQNELRPAVESALSDLGVLLDRILVNVGDPKLTSNDELREFINLDTPDIRKTVYPAGQ